MTAGQVPGGPEATQIGLFSARTLPNLLRECGGSLGVRVWEGSAAGLGRLGREEGQGLVEYGLILVIFAVVCVVSLVFFGDQLSSLLQLITGAV